MISLEEAFDFKVAWCMICNQGWVTIVKDTVTDQYCVMCSECESEWDHPLHAQFNINIKDHNEHLVMTPSLEEIQKLKWSEYIITD